MRYAFSLFFTLLVLSSCFHKDVMTDRADDVAAAFIYSGAEGKSIITKEQIFQAQNKESGGGVTQISGYAEYRITSYDLATGNQTGRVDMGEGSDEAFTIMGTTPGKIWLYSLDPDLGLHCRNPKTLELIADEKTLSSSTPLKGFDFARPEWMKLNQQYGWNAENGKLVVTDMQGFHFYYDPQKNSLEKTEDEIVAYTWATTKTNSTGYFTKEAYVSLRGNGRQKLQFRYEDSTAKFSYLDGTILMDVDPRHDAERKQNMLSEIAKEEKRLNDSINYYLRVFPEMNVDGRSYSKISNDEWKARHKSQDLQRNLAGLKRDYESVNRDHSTYIDHPVLSDAPGNFFVLHGTNVTDTSHMQLTKLNLDGRKSTEVWTVKLNEFYRDPAKANNKGVFETVFSDGNPNFQYQWFEIADNKLFMISQLRMICIDVKTGEILWQHPL